MKPRTDWIAIVAALGVGYLAHILTTAESIVFPAFLGAIMLHCLITRIARPSQ